MHAEGKLHYQVEWGCGRIPYSSDKHKNIHSSYINKGRRWRASFPQLDKPYMELVQAVVIRVVGLPAVIVTHGLHDGQAEAIAVHLIKVLNDGGLVCRDAGLLEQDVELALEDSERCLQFVGGIFGKLFLELVASLAVLHHSLQGGIEAAQFGDVAVFHPRTGAALYAERLHGPERLVERLPQAARQNPRHHDDGNAENGDDEPKLKHYALQDVLFEVEWRNAIAMLYGLDDVYHVFGIKTLCQPVEQRRGEHQQNDDADGELCQILFVRLTFPISFSCNRCV